MPTSFKLGRRALLRGAGVAIGLPSLEAMLGGNGDALADGTPLPKRFVLFYMGNGASMGRYNSTTILGNWLPRDPANGRTIVQGADFPLSETLKPIAPVKNQMRLVSGLHAVSSGGGHHEENMSCALTGFNNKGTLSNTDPRVRAKLGGPTPDFIASKYLGGVTAVRQLRLGVCRKANSGQAIFNNLTFDDGGYPVPSEFDPGKVFDLLFRDFVPANAGTSGPNPEFLRRKSVLDFVRRDAGRLKTKLGKSDQGKIDSHLTSVRELEIGLENLQRPAPASCKVPSRPLLSTDYPTIAKLMTNLLALAFACDRTRVASYMLTKNTSQEVLSWLGFTESFHTLSHGDYLDIIPRMTKMAAWHVEQFAGLVAALAAVPEGAGNVLDSTILVMTSENSDSQGHSQLDIPMLVAGGPKLVRGNFHVRGRGETTCNLWLGCLQALGVPVTKFGDSTAPLALA